MIGAERRPWQRWAWFLLAVVFLAALTTSVASRQSLAQDGDKPAAAADDKGGETAADKSGEAGAEKGAGKASEEKPKKDQDSYFWWFIRSSGWIGFVILLLSIYFIATVGRLFTELRLSIAAPPEVIAHCESLLEQRDFKGIYNVVKEDDSFFSRALATGIAELPNGLGEAREAMERYGESITVDMEKKISMLAVLGTLGPMIGLLGTLMGMISSFSVIAVSDAGLKPAEVAGGISQALVLTFEGVGLSVPSIYFFALFRNRVSHISVTTMVKADEFLRHFAHAARGKTPVASTVAAPAVRTQK